MKRIIYFLLLSICSTVVIAQEKKVANGIDWDKFYKYLGSNVKYPEKAKMLDAQGNSVILLTVTNGAIKKFTVNNANPELGFDEEVVKNLFNYKPFNKNQDGNYALITSFRISDSKSPIKNEHYIIPKGYAELKLVVMGYGANKVGAIDTANSKNGFKINFTHGSLQNPDGKRPLIIVNDEAIEYSLMNTVNPNNIQSISILKDAASTLKYGEEGKNGVIIIQTKDYIPKNTVK
ncbi:TonB-dependent receptor plug domain-containing protein [Pedobacter frigiditerrae]|uniref:TonB-dependent receptor plug domain-containing protein n=1 Tax=Pedobacter frigiditerrae TaxID=2530452 RepID=UPI00292CB9E9|nr:TonB-dependent receptor plug domain-containing protein [Pedobacter frigiditerrae]